MADVMDTIKQQVEGNKVILYMKGTPDFPQCGFSAATVELLRGYPYQFETVDVLANPDIRERMFEYSKWPTFPQLFVAGKLVGGCDIVHELHGKGELEKILQAAHANGS